LDFRIGAGTVLRPDAQLRKLLKGKPQRISRTVPAGCHEKDKAARPGGKPRSAMEKACPPRLLLSAAPSGNDTFLNEIPNGKTVC
jgi:hypothetical protein